MKYKININKTQNSRLGQLDFDNIPFGRTFSDHMFVADYINGEWTNAAIVPYGPIQMNPTNVTLHYGQAVFEGMKAMKNKNGTPVFYRPEDHARRINFSGERLCMPAIPEDLFLEALHMLVNLDQGWIPQKEGSSLYIRPFMYATEECLGVKISDTYKFIIITGPAGPYYAHPVKLLAETEYVRAAVGGVGAAKAAGNYAGSLLPAKKAKEQGYDQILWMDGKEFKYVQEVGTMNVFFVIDNVVITPELNGAILAGITRNSVITILKQKGYTVVEKALDIAEVVEAHKNGTLTEIFGTGTAAVVTNVAELKYGDTVMKLPPIETHKIAALAKSEITKIRSGEIADTNNWMVPVRSAVSV